MAHEILSVKLYELDKNISQVHSRIQMSESEDHAQIQAEVKALQRECMEQELTLRNKLQFSKAGVVASLFEAYRKVEEIVSEERAKIKNPDLDPRTGACSVEDKILFAEYALDFAMQAASNALLISMEALDAQLTQQEKEEEI